MLYNLACLEALACDRPVLSTPVGIAPFALRGIAGTLCAPFDTATWAEVDPVLVDRSSGRRVDGEGFVFTAGPAASRAFRERYRGVPGTSGRESQPAAKDR